MLHAYVLSMACSTFCLEELNLTGNPNVTVSGAACVAVTYFELRTTDSMLQFTIVCCCVSVQSIHHQGFGFAK